VSLEPECLSQPWQTGYQVHIVLFYSNGMPLPILPILLEYCHGSFIDKMVGHQPQALRQLNPKRGGYQSRVVKTGVEIVKAGVVGKKVLSKGLVGVQLVAVADLIRVLVRKNELWARAGDNLEWTQVSLETRGDCPAGVFEVAFLWPKAL
jgi:hypothetical protein